MHFQIGILVLASFGIVYGQFERQEELKAKEHKEPSKNVKEHGVHESRVGEKEHVGSESNIKLSEKTKEKLVFGKEANVFYEKQMDYFLKSPITLYERECYAKNLKPGLSIDFVIDIAPSPSNDKVDKMVAESPFGLFAERLPISGTRAYLNAIELFIDAVTIDMKPETTHSIIYEKGRKFYIRGRDIEDVDSEERLKSRGEFVDESRNLKTLWPVCTKEGFSVIKPIVKNNLGRMTKLALLNRDNGLPIVLAQSRKSKPVYTIVITDGSSGAKIEDLVSDLSTTAIIDVGNRRFVRNMSWDEMRRTVGVFTLMAPQHLPLVRETVRFNACLLSEHASKSM
jgi:hypothetical protein